MATLTKMPNIMYMIHSFIECTNLYTKLISRHTKTTELYYILLSKMPRSPCLCYRYFNLQIVQLLPTCCILFDNIIERMRRV